MSKTVDVHCLRHPYFLEGDQERSKPAGQSQKLILQFQQGTAVIVNDGHIASMEVAMAESTLVKSSQHLQHLPAKPRDERRRNHQAVPHGTIFLEVAIPGLDLAEGIPQGTIGTEVANDSGPTLINAAQGQRPHIWMLNRR